jgi:hypothetical protein
MTHAPVPPLHDYGRSRAVLIGVWDYAFLDPVPAAEHSLREMTELLRGPLCGWPRDRVQVLANELDPGTLPDRLITAFEGISDVALLYFVGHGQITPDDQLSLALTQTRPEPHRRAATSLRFSDVRQALQDSEARIKIVILDCCFAGLATKAAMAGLAGDVLDRTGGTGAYTMAATSAYTTAWYEDDPELDRPQTYFTKYLADLIRTGIPGQPSRLRLDSVFQQLRNNLAADGRPVPQRRVIDDARNYQFAYNTAPPQTRHDSELEVAKLTRQLAEAEAQVQVLRAEAAERETTRAGPAAAGQDRGEEQRELQEQINESTRKLDEIRAALAAALAASDGSPEPGAQSRRRLSKKTALWLTGLAGAVAATIAVLLAQFLPGSAPITFSLARTIPDPRNYTPTAVAFGPDGKILAVGSAKSNSSNDPGTGNTYLWNTVTDKPAGTLSDSGGTGVTAVAWELETTTLAVGDSDHNAYLWNTATGTRTATLADPKGTGVASLAWKPGSTTLAVGDENGATFLWNAANDKAPFKKLEGPSGASVLTVAFNPSGTILAVAEDTEVVDLWNTSTWQPIGTIPDPAAGLMSSLAWAGTRNTLAVGNSNGGTYLWDIAVGQPTPSKPTATLTSPTILITTVGFDPDLPLLAAGAYNGTTYMWNTASENFPILLHDPGGHGVASVAFSTTGVLAVADDNGNTYLWNIKS